MPAAATDLLTRLRSALDPVPERFEPPVDPAAAAVLVLADPCDPRLPVLFMRRSRAVRHHRGQVAFPGGGVEPGDTGPADTALREACEEMGVIADDVEVIGSLPARITGSSMRRLTPIVALERRPLEPRPDGYEVAAWFHLPLADLLEAPVTTRAIPFPVDGRRHVHFIEVDGRIVWGATAAIVVDLLERLGRHIDEP